MAEPDLCSETPTIDARQSVGAVQAVRRAAIYGSGVSAESPGTRGRAGYLRGLDPMRIALCSLFYVGVINSTYYRYEPELDSDKIVKKS